MQIYNARVANFTASTANSIIELATGEDRSTAILEIDAQGAGTTSAHMEAGIFRVSAIGTGTAQTAVTPVNVSQPSSVPTYTGVVGTGAWGTAQATLAANALHPFAVNANGQRYFWRCMPNLSNALFVQGGGGVNGTLSCRFATMPANASIRMQLAEF